METTQQFLLRIALASPAWNEYVPQPKPQTFSSIATTSPSKTQTPNKHIDSDIAESPRSPDAIAEEREEDEL